MFLLLTDVCASRLGPLSCKHFNGHTEWALACERDGLGTHCALAHELVSLDKCAR
jgi:hypothetical protein